MFWNDKFFENEFTYEDRVLVANAIEDHRSSKDDSPRSEYGKLVSSADRNTTIDMVFIRSFFVGMDRMSDSTVNEFLDFTINRLKKKYDEENPENMFYEDETYALFLKDMRSLLNEEEKFKNRYCEINNISDRNRMVGEHIGYEG